MEGRDLVRLATGLNGSVYALAAFDDGSGPSLFAGGDFDRAGGTFVDHVARWDGAAWSGVGRGLDDTVFAVTSFDDGAGPALHVGGLFTTAAGSPAIQIAKWDGAETPAR